MSEQIHNQNNSNESDMRYFPRWEVSGRLSYSLEGEQELHEGATKDLSCAGACIIGTGQIAPHQKINVSIELSESVTIKLNAHILWVRAEDDKRQMGVTFYDTPDDVQELILKHAFETDKEKVIKQWFKGWNDT